MCFTGRTTELSLQDGPNIIEVTNPASGRAVGGVPRLDPPEVRDLVDRARTAQRSWDQLGAAGRARVLHRLRRLMIDQKEDLVDSLHLETGKAYEDNALDVILVANWIRWWADNGPALLDERRIRSSSPFSLLRTNTITRQPHGVVGVIGPWNVPLTLTVGDAVPALMAGNAVVMKPSELTPLTVSVVARMFVEAGGPDDVLVTATGDGKTGAAVVEEVDFVQFTGSVATGRAIASRAAARLIPYSLELGGKDAMIVLADANLERAANAAVHYAFCNAGQICMSVERVYVHADVHDDFVERVVTQTRKLRLGAPAGPGSIDVSAMISPEQSKVVERHVRDAVAKGATVVTGGAPRSGSGTFFEPTVLTNVDHTMECMTEETFGPTMPVMAFRDLDEAIRLANDSRYGLTATVWTRDTSLGERVARRLQVGTVTVNDAMTHLGVTELPFGGHKESGSGARNGEQGLLKFTKSTVIQVNRLPLSRDVQWMPYRRSATRAIGRVFDGVFGRRATQMSLRRVLSRLPAGR